MPPCPPLSVLLLSMIPKSFPRSTNTRIELPILKPLGFQLEDQVRRALARSPVGRWDRCAPFTERTCLAVYSAQLKSKPVLQVILCGGSRIGKTDAMEKYFNANFESYWTPRTVRCPGEYVREQQRANDARDAQRLALAALCPVGLAPFSYNADAACTGRWSSQQQNYANAGASQQTDRAKLDQYLYGFSVTWHGPNGEVENLNPRKAVIVTPRHWVYHKFNTQKVYQSLPSDPFKFYDPEFSGYTFGSPYPFRFNRPSTLRKMKYYKIQFQGVSRDPAWIKSGPHGGFGRLTHVESDAAIIPADKFDEVIQRFTETRGADFTRARIVTEVPAPEPKSYAMSVHSRCSPDTVFRVGSVMRDDSGKWVLKNWCRMFGFPSIADNLSEEQVRDLIEQFTKLNYVIKITPVVTPVVQKSDCNEVRACQPAPCIAAPKFVTEIPEPKFRVTFITGRSRRQYVVKYAGPRADGERLCANEYAKLSLPLCEAEAKECAQFLEYTGFALSGSVVVEKWRADAIPSWGSPFVHWRPAPRAVNAELHAAPIVPRDPSRMPEHRVAHRRDRVVPQRRRDLLVLVERLIGEQEKAIANRDEAAYVKARAEFNGVRRALQETLRTLRS